MVNLLLGILTQEIMNKGVPRVIKNYINEGRLIPIELLVKLRCANTCASGHPNYSIKIERRRIFEG